MISLDSICVCWRHGKCRVYQHAERGNDSSVPPEHAAGGGNRLDERHNQRHQHALRPGSRDRLITPHTDANNDSISNAITNTVAERHSDAITESITFADLNHHTSH